MYVNVKLLLGASVLLLCSATATAQSTYRSPLKAGNPKGASVIGVVECDGKPIADVQVSDGYLITKTDKNGVYRLNSEKRNGQVFITIPSGYMPMTKDALPQFWATLTEDAKTLERHDFLLNPEENDKHRMILVTDIHLANERNDVEDFSTLFIDKLKEVAASNEAQGLPTYTLNLGDASWDSFWYENLYPISEFRNTLKECEYPTTFFNTTGNHDNDGGTAQGPDMDFRAAKPYMAVFGPRYYSFNIGGVHYVVLDNVYYINQPSPKQKINKNITGSRNYEQRITQEQLEWLEKDLAELKDKDTPVFIAFHCPMFRHTVGEKPGSKNELYVDANKANVEDMKRIFAPYKNVHFLTGHTHMNALCPSIEGFENTIWDHTVVGTCGSWWWNSAFGGKNLAPDGNPVGFQILNADGKNVDWRFEAFEYPADKQFFAFDLNKVKEWFATNGEARSFKMHYPDITDYSEYPENTVLVSVFNWDPEGSIEATENGKVLEIDNTWGLNPLWVANYLIGRTNWCDMWPESYGSQRKRRIFIIQAQTPDQPVEITLKDRFGNEWKENFKRPARFDRKDYRRDYPKL